MDNNTPIQARSVVERAIAFCLGNRLLVVLGVVGLMLGGLIMAPFDWDIPGLPRNPVSVDAIPDLGENQQIVFTDWMGRSPQDVEDQITYPLTTALLGVPGVKSIRSFSMFGFSTVYVIFEEGIEFYWARSRIIEKLNSLPPGTVPAGVNPALGPDATALGQIFWYTLEGRDPEGKPAGGWDLHELRTLQDWYVRYALLAANGVSEVASIGGFSQEYQVDVDPDAMRAYDVMLEEVFDAVRRSNVDVGARTIEVNSVEYFVRGLGFIQDAKDIEEIAIRAGEDAPVRIKDVAKVQLGPALRRGVLDKEGAEAVGGVVIARYGANPLEVINSVKEKMAEIAPGLGRKALIDYEAASKADVEAFATAQGFAAYDGASLDQAAWLDWLDANPRAQWPAWATTSQVAVVPFYDRSILIGETLGTLREAISLEILITVIVVMVMVTHLRSSLLISLTLPLAVLMSFIAMKTFGVDANIVALSGIAIAIGTVVDMGIILCENILTHLAERDKKEDRLVTIYRASSEVGSAVLTAVATTVVSFLPVFTMTAAEGKLFRPLAFTKTFALIASVLLALLVVPTLAYWLFTDRRPRRLVRWAGQAALAVAGLVIAIRFAWWAGLPLILLAGYYLVTAFVPQVARAGLWIVNGLVILLVSVVLTQQWLPLGPVQGFVRNFLFVAGAIGGLLGFFYLFQMTYPRLLRWCLDHKMLYLCFPIVATTFGLGAWLGADAVLGWLPAPVQQNVAYRWLDRKLPGFGKEFMPSLDEGSFLFMPNAMPHASLGEATDILQFQDRAIRAIPEVETVVGKIGRVESALDPAPVSMVETLIGYRSEYLLDADGYRLRFAYDAAKGEFARDAAGKLIPDPAGRPYRQWRDEIKTPQDIWDEIVAVTTIPGVTTAPKLQPIETRLLMLQSGIRAPFGIVIAGPDLDTIERVGFDIERLLKEAPEVNATTILADRIVGVPYIEIEIDREAIARYGLQIAGVQDVIEVAIGGNPITQTVEGRERYPVRVRYARELRDRADTLGRILVPTPRGEQIPLEQLADIRYVRGPQMIKSIEGALVGYVLFDKQPGVAEVEVVEACRALLQEKLDSGAWTLPEHVSYRFTGNYENVLRSQRTLAFVIPVALAVIFIILYLQFKSSLTAAMVFTGIGVAWSGGFIMLWLYGQPWFLDFTIAGNNLRDIFQVHTINLSVAIWVGFLALFGIATDDGVVMATYLDQSFQKRKPESVRAIREAVVAAGARRIRPCLMTTATTILALLPVLTSTGRGSDVMIPMAIPAFGGMTLELMTLFLVPTLYCLREEGRIAMGLQGTVAAIETAKGVLSDDDGSLTDDTRGAG